MPGDNDLWASSTIRQIENLRSWSTVLLRPITSPPRMLSATASVTRPDGYTETMHSPAVTKRPGRQSIRKIRSCLVAIRISAFKPIFCTYPLVSSINSFRPHIKIIWEPMCVCHALMFRRTVITSFPKVAVHGDATVGDQSLE